MTDRKSLGEDTCKRCGECCREKIFYGPSNERIIMDYFCPLLDTKTRKCLVYDDRKKMSKLLLGSECLSYPIMVYTMEVPPDCAYVNKYYRGTGFDPERLKMIPRVTRMRLRVENWLTTKMVRRRLRRLRKMMVAENTDADRSGERDNTIERQT